MNILDQAQKTTQKLLVAIALLLVLTFTTACSSSNQAQTPIQTSNQRLEYVQLARGNTVAGQDFSNWLIETSKGLIKDTYVRDGNKLGVVISSQVLPKDVKTLAQSLAQGFRHNFPNQDLTVMIYAPDKKLILTARYDNQSKQIDYQQPS
jgi:hypothetical protein